MFPALSEKQGETNMPSKNIAQHIRAMIQNKLTQCTVLTTPTPLWVAGHTGVVIITAEVEYENTGRVTADAAEGPSAEDTDVVQAQNADALAASLTKNSGKMELNLRSAKILTGSLDGGYLVASPKMKLATPSL
jgi:hypothetical protein